MKHSFLCLTVLAVCFFTGCGQSIPHEPKAATIDIHIQTEYLSDVPQKDCYVCGGREDSLVPYYSTRDSIGIIHWNTPSVSDTEVRAYDDNGKELFNQEHTNMRMSSFGDGYGSVWISGNPNRGMTDVTAHYEEKDEVDLDAAKTILCQKCLDKVVSFYTDQEEYGEENHNGTTGYCLIDFQTRELYTLSDPYRGYFIRDYYVTYDISDGENSRIDVLIFYAPERKN